MQFEYTPLVSICIPNYNYAPYLDAALASVYSQNYSNIEVYVSDNFSTDNSYDIAYKWRKKFIEKGIFFGLHQNKTNRGSEVNSRIASRDSEGEILYTLASDDIMEPNFLENVLPIFQKYPTVGVVFCNRKEIDDAGNVTETIPFYNKSCIIPGESQAAVHMLTGLGIPAQRIYRREVINRIAPYQRVWQVAGDWYENFLYSCVSDIAYLKDSLVQYRVHIGNETNESELNLTGVMEHYLIINQFVDVAESIGLKKPQKRYPEAIEHLSIMCLRYAVKMIKLNREDIAMKYLHQATIFNPDIIKDKRYMYLLRILENCDGYTIKSFDCSFPMQRSVSYDPPEDAVELFL